MDFEYTPKVKDLQKRVSAFMEAHIYPAEEVFEHEMDAFRKVSVAARNWDRSAC